MMRFRSIACSAILALAAPAYSQDSDTPAVAEAEDVRYSIAEQITFKNVPDGSMANEEPQAVIVAAPDPERERQIRNGP